MKRFREIFRLEFTAFVRSKALAALIAAGVAWVVALPYVVRNDGTAEGAREISIHYSLTGVFILLVVALVSSATASIARERAEKRLQLTLVRPVRYFTVALAKIAAHTAVAAVVLAFAMAALAVNTDLARRCWHVHSPVLPSPRQEALDMYEVYMNDPSTGEDVKKADKSVVLRLLEQRAHDHYQTIPTNSAVTWEFSSRAGVQGDLAVRLRFTNQFEMRQNVSGVFRLGGATGIVSNITQAVVDVPLCGTSGVREGEKRFLRFENHGDSSLMLRPRKDIKFLAEGDAFWMNLVRAYLELVSVIALLTAFAVFLSACLGRPVALFTATVALVVGEMSPSVVSQYPDMLETDRLDRIGLALTRAAAGITRPVSSLSPLGSLAKDECIEPEEVFRALAVNMLALPVALALLAALAMPFKQDD